jgi:hypothetical protein
VGDAGLERRVTGVGHDAEVGLGPGAMQVPGRRHRADHVVAALHDHRRDVADAAHAAQQLVLALEEALVHEVVALDARHGDCEILLAPFVHVLVVGVQEAGGRFPDRPGTCGPHPRGAAG